MEYVYRLVDPRDGFPRYVGLSNNPDARYKQHTSIKDDCSTVEKRAWIAELRTARLVPGLDILQSVDHREPAKRLESRYIWLYTVQGIKLFNAEVQWYWRMKSEMEDHENVTSIVAIAQSESTQLRLENARLQSENRELHQALSDFQSLRSLAQEHQLLFNRLFHSTLSRQNDVSDIA